MQKSKIEWTDYVWNPIKGLCPVGCWYCYARKMYQRFGKYIKPTFWPHLVSEPKGIRKPSKIFVCSTFELFHPTIEKGYRDEIFETIEACPQHTFQILTKLPHLIDRPMPDNVWLGVTVTKDEDVHRIKSLIEVPARIKFVSIEPFLSPIFKSAESFIKYMNWIIIGRLTGHGKKHDPKHGWIKGFEVFARNRNIPVFLKNNLKEIWGEPLIQEMPSP